MSVGLNIADGNLTWQAERVESGSSYFAMPRGNMNFSPTAPFGTSMEEYFAFGRSQTITFTPNQNNIVDTANYNYGWDILDYAKTENVYTSLKINITNISSFQAY
jgi:hypothetical protein